MPDIVRVEFLANVIVSVAVVICLQIERILRSQNAGIGSEIERQEAAIGNVVQSVAVGEIRLDLERCRNPTGKRNGYAVIVRDTRRGDVGDGAKPSVDRGCGQ